MKFSFISGLDTSGLGYSSYFFQSSLFFIRYLYFSLFQYLKSYYPFGPRIYGDISLTISILIKIKNLEFKNVILAQTGLVLFVLG